MESLDPLGEVPSEPMAVTLHLPMHLLVCGWELDAYAGLECAAASRQSVAHMSLICPRLKALDYPPIDLHADGGISELWCACVRGVRACARAHEAPNGRPARRHDRPHSSFVEAFAFFDSDRDGFLTSHQARSLTCTYFCTIWPTQQVSRRWHS